MPVTGKTKLVGLFGYPVKHTASPAFHNAAFEALELDWIYLPLEVRPDQLRQAVEGITALGFVGVNCTIPHKQAVMEFMDEISEEAEMIGAVNTVHITDKGLKGYNTDGIGFIRSLRELEPSGVNGKRLFLMGAGGAGRAIAVQSVIENASAVMICDKDEERAKELEKHIGSKIGRKSTEFVPFDDKGIAEAAKSADIFVDATPLGMHEGDPVSIDAEWLRSGTLVMDLVYKPAETSLLKAAADQGCRTLNGLGMLLYQGAKSFEIWTGIDAPIDAMRPALENAVYGPKSS